MKVSIVFVNLRGKHLKNKLINWTVVFLFSENLLGGNWFGILEIESFTFGILSVFF